jgi:nucleoside-diphosphate-sugar epimerase
MTSSSKSSSHILISGGAGFIGTSLARKLKKTHRVTIFDNFSEQIHGNRDVPRDPDLSYYVGDVRSQRPPTRLSILPPKRAQASRWI